MTRIEFTNYLRELLNFAHYNGIVVHVDYVKRSFKTQVELYNAGRSGTLNSRHLVGKAVDLAVYDPDSRSIKWDGPEYEKLGTFWESLDKRCVWGGRWRKRDIYHFEGR